jgi:hypothetical protein
MDLTQAKSKHTMCGGGGGSGVWARTGAALAREGVLFACCSTYEVSPYAACCGWVPASSRFQESSSGSR